MTNIELVALRNRVYKELLTVHWVKSAPSSLSQLLEAIERELLIRGYDLDRSYIPADVLVGANQETAHKTFGKAKAGRSAKISKN